MSAYENFAKVKAIIEERRNAAISTADMRNEEVRSRSSIIREIDEELKTTGPKILAAACAGADLEPIKKRNLYLMDKRRGELVKMGLPEDYTDVHYFCKKCSDSGFIGGVKLCSCFREALTTENIKSSGIGALIEKQSFDNFNLEIYKNDPEVYANMTSNYSSAKRYAEALGKSSQNLVLIGTTGSGKTHISTAIAKVAITRGLYVIYDSAQNIVNDFETDRFKSGYGPYEPKADKYLECDLLIIDDLGTEFLTPFALSCLYNLLNTRINRGLPTVVSTNLTPQEISGRYEARICSRLFGNESMLLNFKGSDYRITQRKKGK